MSTLEVKNFPGTQSVVPYKSSADIQWQSCFSVMQIPNNPIGSESTQSVALGYDLMMDFKYL